MISYNIELQDQCEGNWIEYVVFKIYYGIFCLFLILMLVYFFNDFYFLFKIEQGKIMLIEVFYCFFLGMCYCILIIEGFFSRKNDVCLIVI